MPLNESTTYDLNVNHSVIFRCNTHKELLAGMPAFVVEHRDGEVHFMVDTSDMWCPDPSQDLKDGDEFDCMDNWTTTVEGLHVAP